MGFIHFAAAVTALGILAPANVAARDAWFSEPLSANQTVFVTWEANFENDSQMVLVKDSTRDHILAYACGNQVNLNGVKIELIADETGRGEMIVGDSRYTLDDDVEASGGIVCEGRWNPSMAATECEVPWTIGSVEGEIPLPLDIAVDCLGTENDLAILGPVYNEDELIEEVWDEEDWDDELFSSDVHSNSTSLGTLAARQGPVCQPRRSITRKGNGSPHKWRRHKILTNPLNCKDGTCAQGYLLEVKWSHEAGFSVSGAGKASWISGSYKVTWSRTEADYAHCGAKRGEKVCVSHWMRYQEYTVERADWSTCSPSKKKYKTYKIRSPLKGPGQQELDCVRGSGCKGKGYIRWEDRGKGKHGGA